MKHLGWISTEGLPMPPRTTTIGDATRVDIQQRDVMPALNQATTTQASKPEYSGTPSRATPPDTMRTVYVTLNREEIVSHHSWQMLAHGVRAILDPFTVQELDTAGDALQPCMLWVVLVPGSVVVDTRTRLRRLLQSFSVPAQIIWADADPTYIRGRG